jgi:DNA polymerase-4
MGKRIGVLKKKRKFKKILLCDLDAFYASVEQVDNPVYRGKPVIIGGRPEARGVVSTCSYEARALGVRSALPMAKAMRLCPEGIFLPVNMNRYKEISRHVMAILGSYTPEMERVSIDEAYLAVSPGEGEQTAIAIREKIRHELGLPVSVGVSSNKLLAKIACELAKPDGWSTLWKEDVKTRLWPLSIRFLPGIGPVTEKKLNRLGVKTIGELAVFPLDSLQHLLGKTALNLHKYSKGEDDRNLETTPSLKSISEETTFARDIKDSKEMKAALMELAEGIGYRLRLQKMKARTISLKLRFSDFRTITRTISLTEATDKDSMIFQSACRLFLPLADTFPWRLVGIRASGLENFTQLSLNRGEDKEKSVTRVQDELRTRFGKEVLYRAQRLFPDSNDNPSSKNSFS